MQLQVYVQCAARTLRPNKVWETSKFLLGNFLIKTLRKNPASSLLSFSHSAPVSQYQQDVLISVLSPEVDRFADKLMWKAVIFNDNLPELTQKELDGLPDALIDLPGTTGMVIMSDVDKLNAGDCSFVDNRVMKYVCCKSTHILLCSYYAEQNRLFCRLFKNSNEVVTGQCH